MRMESCDTNILLYYLNADCLEHDAARKYLEPNLANSGFAICELVLMELYTLLRNPAVLARPFSAPEAVETVQVFRDNPSWALIDCPGGLMSKVWAHARRLGVSRSAIFDARLAVTLRHFGVDTFATHNPKHFVNFGFREVIDPVG